MLKSSESSKSIEEKNRTDSSYNTNDFYFAPRYCSYSRRLFKVLKSRRIAQKQGYLYSQSVIKVLSKYFELDIVDSGSIKLFLAPSYVLHHSRPFLFDSMTFGLLSNTGLPNYPNYMSVCTEYQAFFAHF